MFLIDRFITGCSRFRTCALDLNALQGTNAILIIAAIRDQLLLQWTK